MIRTLCLAGLLMAFLCLFPLSACAAEETSAAESYLEKAPLTAQQFFTRPFASIHALITKHLFSRTRGILRAARGLFGLLLCGAACKFLAGDSRWDTLLEWVFACGCFLQSEPLLLELSRLVAEQSILWKDFLFGFLPVYAASMASSGQVTGAALCNGFFLTAVSWTAQLLHTLILPVFQMLLAVTAAGIFTDHTQTGTLSRKAGGLLCKLISWLGIGFSALMGIQRVFAGAADGAAAHTGQAFLYSSVPIVGQAIGAAAGGVLAGMKLLQGGLSFAALSLVAVQFCPLWGQILVCWGVFTAAGFLSSLLGLSRSEALFEGLAAGSRVLSAVLGLYFSMLSVGLFMMLILGGGSL